MGKRYRQGRIEPPKSARGHATHIDGKVLNIEFKSYTYDSLINAVENKVEAPHITKCIHLDGFQY